MPKNTSNTIKIWNDLLALGRPMCELCRSPAHLDTDGYYCDRCHIPLYGSANTGEYLDEFRRQAGQDHTPSPYLATKRREGLPRIISIAELGIRGGPTSQLRWELWATRMIIAKGYAIVEGWKPYIIGHRAVTASFDNEDWIIFYTAS